MVSPMVVRKINQDKGKKVISKVRSETRSRNFLDPGHNIGVQKRTMAGGGCSIPSFELINQFGHTRVNIGGGADSSRPHQLLEKTKPGSFVSTLPPTEHVDMNTPNLSVPDVGFPCASTSTRSSNKTNKILTPAFSDIGATGSFVSTTPPTELLDMNNPNLSVPDVDSSRPKKKRGKTIGLKLAKTLKQGQKLEVLFPGHVKRPVGVYSNLFTTEIGVLVRQIAPLQAESWAFVSREKKDSIMARLRDKFIFSSDPEVVLSVEYTMARRYNTWRYNIHDKFLEFRNIAAALSNPPPMKINFDDWMYLCNLFSTPKFKARSERNKKNKQKMRSAHVAGTKAYSKIRYDKRNAITQEELEFTELYETTHRRESDKSWVDENAREFHEILKEHKLKAEQEGRKLTDEELSVLTFGNKPGYLCGLGHGPKPTFSVTGKRTRAELVREAYEANKRADLAEKSALALAEKLKMVEDQQAKATAKLREDMNMQFALFREHFFSNSSGQANEQCGGRW